MLHGWQGARDAALEREAQLTAEKAQLKAGLGTALEQKALLDTQLATALSEQQTLRSQVRSGSALFFCLDMNDSQLFT